MWLFIHFLLVYGAGSFEVTISPSYIHSHYGKSPRYVTLVCRAGVSLTHCQYSVYYHPFIELSVQFNSYKYGGREFQARECSTEIDTHSFPLGGYNIRCRVRNESSGWKYASVALFNTNKEGINIKLRQRIIVVHPFKTHTTILKFDDIINRCRVSDYQWSSGMDRKNIEISTSVRNVITTPGNYFESGCKIVISATNNTNSGIIWFEFVVQSRLNHLEYIEYDFLQLVVAKIPKKPVLIFRGKKPNANGTQTIQVGCITTGSEPAANISWFLNGQHIRNVRLENVAETNWPSPHSEPQTEQILNIDYDEKDVGKHLWCSASHILLGDLLLSSNEYPIPKPPHLPSTPTLKPITTSRSPTTATTSRSPNTATTSTTIIYNSTAGSETNVTKSNVATNELATPKPTSGADTTTVSITLIPTDIPQESTEIPFTTIIINESTPSNLNPLQDTRADGVSYVMAAAMGVFVVLVIAALFIYVWRSKRLCFAHLTVLAKEDGEDPRYRRRDRPQEFLSMINAETNTHSYIEPIAHVNLQEISQGTVNARNLTAIKGMPRVQAGNIDPLYENLQYQESVKVTVENLPVPRIRAPPRPPSYDYVYDWRRPKVLQQSAANNK